MDGFLDYWPVLLSGVAVIVFAVRQENIGRSVVTGLDTLTKKVTEQNGRIGKLEKWQAYEKGRHGVPFNGDNGGN